MKSNLFKQLEQLKTSQTARDLKKNRYASLLFPFQQAASFDRDTIKSIATQGLGNLVVHDPSLQGLSERLFSTELDHLKREQLNSAQNQEISEFLQETIRELAPYFLLEDCQKVFEYLLRNFEVHNYEADTLIVALMPYHSTVYYVKLLQNIDLNKTNHWVFLEKNVREGVVIPRSLVARQCVLDNAILDMITRNIIKMVESKGASNTRDVFFNVGGASTFNKGGVPQKNIEVSFGMLVAVETIGFAKEKKKINENLLITLMRFLSFCLKNQSPEVFRAGLVVTLQLTSSTSLNVQYVGAIVRDVSKKLTEASLMRDILLLYVYVHQMNDNFSMPAEVFNELVDHLDNVLETLVEISQTFSVTNLLLAFYRHVCGLFNPEDQDKTSTLVKAFSRLLKMVVNNEPHLQESSKRLHFARILVQEIFNNLIIRTRDLAKEQKFAIIAYLSTVLTEIKNCLPDQVTEALKELLQNGEMFKEHSKQIKRLLNSTFSKLYIEGVLGIELAGEESGNAEYKQLLPTISPFHPVSANTKLKALERIEELLEGGEGDMQVEGEESVQATLSNIVLSHFRTHSYNEKVLEGLLKSQRIQSLFEAEALVRQLIEFMRKYYKTPANKEITEPVKQIYTIIVEKYSELSEEGAQETKEFLVETLLSHRTRALKENLKGLKKTLPTFFKPVKASSLESATTQEAEEGILDSYAKSLGLDSLNELEEEFKKAKSNRFKEIIKLVQVSILEGLTTVLPNIPENVFTLLKGLRSFVPNKISSFVARFSKLAQALSEMEQDKRLDSRPQIVNVATEAIFFLVNLQDTSAVPVIKDFIELFGEEKLLQLLLIGHSLAKNNQERQFVILALFIHNILSAEDFSQKDFFHEIMLIIPFLEVPGRQIRLQALSILSNISKKVKKQSNDTINVAGYEDYYTGNILNDALFEVQIGSSTEQIQVPSASFYKFIKNILKHENELTGSSTMKALSQILERLGTSFADYEWLFKFLMGNLFVLPVRQLFTLALEILSFIDSKFHQEVVQREEVRQLLGNIERIISYVNLEKTKNLQKEAELLGNLLQKLGKIFSDNDSKPLVNEYFEKVFSKIVALCDGGENPLAPVILSTFGKANYLVLTHENQLELLELMFTAVSQGVPMSQILSSLVDLETTDDLLIMFGENMLENFNVDTHLAERLTFLAELLHFLNRKSLKYLPLLNQIYQHALTKPQEDTLTFIEKVQYSLSLFVSLHKQILTVVIEAKTQIDFSKAPQAIHKKSKTTIPIKNLAGDSAENTESYAYITSVKDLASILLRKDNGALLEDTAVFALIKELLGCLTTYTAFLLNYTSNVIVKLLSPIYKGIDSRSPKMQVYALRLLGHVLSLSNVVLKTQFDIHPYIKLFLRVLYLKGKIAAHVAGLPQSVSYQFSETEKEISSIIKTIGQKNLDYIVYGMISNLIRRVSTEKGEKQLGKKGVANYDTELNSAVSIIFSSEKLEEPINVLYKIVQNTENVCSYYLSRMIELDKKKKKILVKSGSIGKGKKVISNYNLTKLQAQRSFLSISLYFEEKSLQSQEFMTAFSNYLVKGNVRPEVTEEFANLITALSDLKHLISQGLSKLQTQKLVTHTKATGTNNTLKKKVKTKNFLKKMNILVERLLEGLQELIPEEILTHTCSRILERETVLRVKSKALQMLSDKLSNIGSPKLTLKSLAKLRELLESSLVEPKDDLLNSRSAETASYLQSVFLCLGSIIRKKPKTFEDGMNEAVFEYSKHAIFPVRCSAFYMISLFSEKFPNKAVGHLPTVATELLLTVLLCIKYTEQHNYEGIVEFATEKNPKLLGELANRAQSEEKDEESVQSPESCFVLCINSLILLLKTYKDMMNPYILSIIMIFSCLNGNQLRVQELLSFVNNNIEARNLVEPLSIAGEAQNRFSHVFGKRVGTLVGDVCQQMEADTFESKNQTLFKLFLKAFDYGRNIYQAREDPLSEEENQEVQSVQDTWTEAFCKFALKTNEVQLKKFFLKLNEWSSKGTSEEEHKFSLLRKITLYQLVGKLFDSLRGFFVQYMAFFFDFCLDQLIHYTQTYKIVQKGSRRRKPDGDITKTWEVTLHKLILQVFTKCFAYDKDNDFIDSNKFDKLVDPLVDQLECIGIPTKYDEFVNDAVQPAILQLFEVTKDDYKWKSLNYALLMKTRSEVGAVKLAAVKIVLRIVEQLKERTAVLINDILPFLSETLEDEDIEVEKISKEIVIRLEQITGENIKEYLKS